MTRRTSWSALTLPSLVAPTYAPPVGSGDVGTLDAAMKRHIERALAVTRGRIEGRGGTADILGINPHTLRARMRKLKIEWSRFRG